MTPAERIADYREELALLRRNSATNFRLALEDITRLLALAEAVPVLLATVSEGDRRWMSGPMVEAVDRLAAAWAALGKETTNG